MLVEMAVGDAYGIGFEFVERENWPGPNDLSQMYQHPTYLELKPGMYTDDTQRALANAEVVLAGSYLDVRAYAEAYVNAYKRDPREGYSRRYQEYLKTHPDAKSFLLDLDRTAVSNGSLMGVAPLGFIGDIREVKLASMIQAISTHSPETAIHAQVIALAAHYFLYEIGPKDRLIEFLKINSDAKEWDYITDKTSKTTIRAKSVVNTMLTGILMHDDLCGLLKWSVDLEGDTDSAAATCMAIGALVPEIDNNLGIGRADVEQNYSLYHPLEDGEYGKSYLLSMDNLLYDLL